MTGPEGLEAGDHDAMRAVVLEHTAAIARWVRRYADGRAEAEDLVQEVWKRVLDRPGSYRGTGSIRGWLYAVTRSVCLDHVRRRAGARGGEVSLDARGFGEGRLDLESPAPGPAADLAARRQSVLVHAAVDALPPRQRETVTRRILDGLSTRETADAMNCAEGTVKAALSQALASLRTHFGDRPE